MSFLFWLFLILIIYTYAGYPVLIWIIGVVSPKPVIKKQVEPTVVVITSAYNEKDHIEATVRNKFEQDYPKDKLHYVVVSDASTDGTDEIVKKLQSEYKNLHFIRQDERAGKTSALNKAYEYCVSRIAYSERDADPLSTGRPGTDSCRPRESGDLAMSSRPQSRDLSTEIPASAGTTIGDNGDVILIFSDANSIYKPGAIKALIRNFADPTVGYVTGKMVYQTKTDSGVSEGCGAYMAYENTLRKLETKVGSVIGVDGGIDACRLELYEDMDAEDLPDFVLPLTVMQKNYRVVYEPEAVIVEDANETHEEEFSMRVRVALRSIHALMKFKDLSFNVFNNGLVSWQIISHKGFRYDIGWMQLVVFITNYFLIPAGTLYHVLFTLQLVFYALAVYGYVRSGAAAVILSPEGAKDPGYLNQVNEYPGSFVVPPEGETPQDDSKRRNDDNGATKYDIRNTIYSVIRLCYYLCLVNYASMVAGIQWLRGKKLVTWNPRT
ncbi:MAG: glycosyltransferase [Candidatus Omnitrophica bacterium]|nr:glycosyltransferase [Candidatus Omnitrophota bacterium]